MRGVGRRLGRRLVRLLRSDRGPFAVGLCAALLSYAVCVVLPVSVAAHRMSGFVAGQQWTVPAGRGPDGPRVTWTAQATCAGGGRWRARWVVDSEAEHLHYRVTGLRADPAGPLDGLRPGAALAPGASAAAWRTLPAAVPAATATINVRTTVLIAVSGPPVTLTARAHKPQC